MPTTPPVEGEEDSGPSSLRSFPCLKIPDLILDSPAGLERDGLPHPGADVPTPSGLLKAPGPGPLEKVGTPGWGTPPW